MWAKLVARASDRQSGASVAMKVRVGKYAYLWEGAEPLVPGDRVLLPENWLSRTIHGPGPFEDTVTAVGSDYDGPMSRVIAKIGRDPDWRPPEPDTLPAPRVSLVHEGRYQQALAEYDRQVEEWRRRAGGTASDPVTVGRARLVTCPKCGAPESSPCTDAARPRKANHQERLRRFRAWMQETHPRYPRRETL